MLDGSGQDLTEAAETIAPDAILSAETSAINIAELFSKSSRHFYFVLQESEITGTIHYEDLLTSPFDVFVPRSHLSWKPPRWISRSGIPWRHGMLYPMRAKRRR